MLTLILLVLAFVLLALAAANVTSPPRLSLGWAGLACVVLAEILTRSGGFMR